MTDTNHYVCTGRVVRDADEKSFSTSTYGSRLNFSIAVTKTTMKKDKTFEDYVSYFDIVLWGKLADKFKPLCKKGTMVSVEGELKQDRWEDKNDHSKKSRITIVAKNVLLAETLYKNQSSSSSDNGVQNSHPSNDEGFPEDYPF
jgi:single-strand DNA-binding protein